MLFMGIDVGSSGCKISVIDEFGNVVCFASREYSFTYKNGCSELNPDIVWQCVFDAICEIAKKQDLSDLKTISATSFGEMFVLLDEKKEVIAPSISYEDERGKEELESLPCIDRIYEITGANPDVMFSLSKLIWIKKHTPTVYQNAKYFCAFADFVLFRMGAEHHTDFSLAARTLMLDVKNKCWSDEILKAAEINRNMLGRLVSSGTKVGTVSKDLANKMRIPEDVLLLAGGHDQPCAALGAGITKSGVALDGMGSNECIVPAFDQLMINEIMRRSNLVCVPHIVPNMYVTYAFNRTAGSLFRWYNNILGQKDYQSILNEMPEKPTELLVLPHFAGAATPYMDNNAVGGIVGLKLSTDRGTLTKGIVEGMNYEMLLNLRCLKKAGFNVEKLYVSGGLSKSDEILQIKADILGIPILKLSNPETGTVGTVVLGSVAMGLFETYQDAVNTLVKTEKEFLPNMENHELYKKQFVKYNKMYHAIKNLMEVAEDE